MPDFHILYQYNHDLLPIPIGKAVCSLKIKTKKPKAKLYFTLGFSLSAVFHYRIIILSH
jgi:hypothetical protein